MVRFYAASIALALEHMHDRNIAYRNLKPETVLLDNDGYIRLTGMGFAKRVPFINAQGTLSGQTFTFCGTLEYLSPEMVLNLGHDQGVDKWALGVTIYEMITGITPFEVDMATTGAATPNTRRLSADGGVTASLTKATLHLASQVLDMSQKELSEVDQITGGASTMVPKLDGNIPSHIHLPSHLPSFFPFTTRPSCYLLSSCYLYSPCYIRSSPSQHMIPATFFLRSSCHLHSIQAPALVPVPVLAVSTSIARETPAGIGTARAPTQASPCLR